MKITITAKDGEVFKGEDYFELEKRVLSYEQDLDAKVKEAEKRAAEKQNAYNQILEETKTINTMIKEYNLATGEQLYAYATVNGEFAVVREINLNGLDLSRVYGLL
jgi:hypothetical protein